VTVSPSDFATAIYGPDTVTKDTIDFGEIVYHCAGILKGNEDISKTEITGVSTELEASQVTHDCDETEPLVIGIRLGSIATVSDWDRPHDNLTSIDFTALTSAQAKFTTELAKLTGSNESARKLFYLIQSQVPRLLFVQDDCRCCS
jgi:hypothetical protein